jgi:hypothetical protein
MDSPERCVNHSIPGASAAKAATASGNSGASLLALLTCRDIGCNVRDCGSVDLSTAKSPSVSLLSGSSQFASSSRARMTGMRLWTQRTSGLASVTQTLQD